MVDAYSNLTDSVAYDILLSRKNHWEDRMQETAQEHVHPNSEATIFGKLLEKVVPATKTLPC